MERAGIMKRLWKKSSTCLVPGKIGKKGLICYTDFLMVYINMLLQDPEKQAAIPPRENLNWVRKLQYVNRQRKKFSC